MGFADKTAASGYSAGCMSVMIIGEQHDKEYKGGDWKGGKKVFASVDTCCTGKTQRTFEAASL